MNIKLHAGNPRPYINGSSVKMWAVFKPCPGSLKNNWWGIPHSCDIPQYHHHDGWISQSISWFTMMMIMNGDISHQYVCIYISISHHIPMGSPISWLTKTTIIIIIIIIINHRIPKDHNPSSDHFVATPWGAAFGEFLEMGHKMVVSIGLAGATPLWMVYFVENLTKMERMLLRILLRID